MTFPMVPPPKLPRIGNNGDEATEDVISNLPEVVIDKILQLLPLAEVARMSVLSKNWQNNWSCIRSLCFDIHFGLKLEKEELDWQKFSTIISNIFLLHQGPIHEFLLVIPTFITIIDFEEVNVTLSRWLCFLSRNGVKKIALYNNIYLNHTIVSISSHILLCKELEELVLDRFGLISPSAGFKDFVHLSKLELTGIKVSKDIIESLIAACPKLASLKVQNTCSAVNGLVIDAPRLENLSLSGNFTSLTFKNVPSLAQLQLHLIGIRIKPVNIAFVVAIKNLARSCELESLSLGLKSLKFLAAGGLRKHFPLPLNHITELSLRSLDLNDFDVFCCTFGLLQSCPSLVTLNIWVDGSKNVDIQHEFDYNNNNKLGHLREVKCEGLTGSCAELKLIEYVLYVSIVLEKLFLKFLKLDDSLGFELHKKMNGFQRGSPKARIVCLD